ncbi:MAG: ABC transporter permease [Chloroflexota bacterium]
MQLTSDVRPSFRSSATRPGPVDLLLGGIREIVSRRRLVRYLVQADLKKKGADTILGNVWWVIDPLLQMLVYVILVSVIFHRGKPDYPLFIFAAILPWKWFQSTVYDGISSVTGAGGLIKQVHFPKLVLPVAAAVSSIANFAFGLIPLFALMVLFYADRLSSWLLLLPVIAAVQFVFGVAFAIALGALNVFYRDIANVARHALRLWFYLSPGLYELTQLQDALKDHPSISRILLANPFATLFTAYRAVIYDGTAPDWASLGILLAVSALLVGLAIVVFKRVEPTFAKVL